MFPTDPDRDSSCSLSQRDSVLLLRGRHLSGLLLLWLDRFGTVPRQGDHKQSEIQDQSNIVCVAYCGNHNNHIVRLAGGLMIFPNDFK